MPLPLPPSGDTNWYAHYQSIHNDVTDLLATPPGETLGTGVVQLDSFSGSDTSKFQQANTYAAAQTRVPWIQFPGRDVSLTGTFPFYPGMKLLAPGFVMGPKNLEIASGSVVNHRVLCTAGMGASSVFRASGTINTVTFAGLAFQAGNTTTQLASSVGGNGIYPAEFYGITAYGFASVWGSASEKFLATQSRWTGHHTYLAHRGQQFQFGGSDNDFWVEGYLNMNSPSSISGSGVYQGRFDSNQKSRIGFMYITVEGSWAGIQFSGTGENFVFGGVYEGRAADNPAQYPLVNCSGGKTVFMGTHFGYVADTANTDGGIHISGANTYVKLDNCSYLRATSTAAAFPLAYSTAGVLRYDDLIPLTTGEQIRLRFATAGSGGNLFTVPALADSTH